VVQYKQKEKRNCFDRHKLKAVNWKTVLFAKRFFEVAVLGDYKKERYGGSMTGVRIKENESFESALKRFKKQCEKAGILSEIKKREHYEKPSVRRKKKALAARKKALKRARLASR
jgi:small subunit ribosomal protein S21